MCFDESDPKSEPLTNLFKLVINFHSIIHLNVHHVNHKLFIEA